MLKQTIFYSEVPEDIFRGGAMLIRETFKSRVINPCEKFPQDRKSSVLACVRYNEIRSRRQFMASVSPSGSPAQDFNGKFCLKVSDSIGDLQLPRAERAQLLGSLAIEKYKPGTAKLDLGLEAFLPMKRRYPNRQTQPTIIGGVLRDSRRWWLLSTIVGILKGFQLMSIKALSPRAEGESPRNSSPIR